MSGIYDVCAHDTIVYATKGAQYTSMGDMEVAGIINTTPHDIHVFLKGGKQMVYPKSSIETRMTAEPQVFVGDLADDTPVYSAQKFTGVHGLPPDGKEALLVSMVVGDYLRDTGYMGRVILGPDSSPEGSVRDNGHIVGTKRLVYYTGPLPVQPRVTGGV